MSHGTDQDTAGWGPTVEGRGRRRRPLRWLALLLVVVLLLLVAVPLLASSRIPRIPVDGVAGSGSPYNLLVVGSDSREDLTPEERVELSTGTGFEGERTDTIFLMSVHGGEVALLAFPRDLWVRRCDGSEGRINAAQQLAGPSCLVRTVSELSGLDVHGYASVTFGGFVDIVDAVGGVELCLEDAIQDDDAGIDLLAGCQVLDGPDALGYVRVRKIDNDLERIRRQQRFVQALAREVVRPAILLNPLRLWELSGEVGDALTLDRGTGPIDLARLAIGARGLVSGELTAHTVPTDPTTTSGGAAVLVPREGEAAVLFDRFRDGSVHDDEGDGIDRSEITVDVHNGAQVDGLAARVGDLLEGRGYGLGEVGNTDARDTTVVRHPPGAGPAAALVAEDLPGDPELEETSDVTVVTVLLGRDAAGA